MWQERHRERNAAIYGESQRGMQQRDIAAKYGVSISRIKQVVDRARRIEKLRVNGGSPDAMVAEILMSVRARRVFDCLGVETLAEASRFTQNEVLRLRGIRRKTLAEVEAILAAHGLSLAPSGHPPIA